MSYLTLAVSALSGVVDICDMVPPRDVFELLLDAPESAIPVCLPAAEFSTVNNNLEPDDANFCRPLWWYDKYSQWCPTSVAASVFVRSEPTYPLPPDFLARKPPQSAPATCAFNANSIDVPALAAAPIANTQPAVYSPPFADPNYSNITPFDSINLLYDSLTVNNCTDVHCSAFALQPLDAKYVSIVSRLGSDTLYLIVSIPSFIEYIKFCISLYPNLSWIQCILVYPETPSTVSGI